MLAVVLAALTATPTLADDPQDQAKLEAFLEDPIKVFRADRTPPGFRIIALSNLAEYCGRRGHDRCLRRTAEIAALPELSPYQQKDPLRVDLGQHNLYLAHWLVVLTEFRARLDDPGYDPLIHRIAEHLRKQTGRAGDHHIPSYPNDPARYPADQSVVLFSLHRYDRIFGTRDSEPLVKAWLRYMATKGASGDGLHRSEVAGAYSWSPLPRGCAMSWTIRYMATFAPEQARPLWERYTDRFEINVYFLGGFREWPLGFDGPADNDSGPIVLGVGVAATAFAVAASRAVDDDIRHQRLVLTMRRVYAAVDKEGPEGLHRAILARTIALNGVD